MAAVDDVDAIYGIAKDAIGALNHIVSTANEYRKREITAEEAMIEIAGILTMYALKETKK